MLIAVDDFLKAFMTMVIRAHVHVHTHKPMHTSPDHKWSTNKVQYGINMPFVDPKSNYSLCIRYFNNFSSLIQFFSL